MAATRAWLRFCGMEESASATIRAALAAAGVELVEADAGAACSGIVCFGSVDEGLLSLLREVHRAHVEVLAVAASSAALSTAEVWRVLEAGAADTLVWPADGSVARQIHARLERW